MKVEVKNGVTFLYPDTNMKLKRIDGYTLFSIVALAQADTAENYEEVDEFWVPETEETIDSDELFEDLNRIEPDSQGKVDYNDVRKVVDAMNILKRRFIELENKINK